MSDKWMTIDSAPKNGTPLLLWVPDGGWDLERSTDIPTNITVGAYTAAFMQSACWLSSETYTEFWDYGGYTGAGTTEYQCQIKPSHWMPLPPAPEEDSKHG